MHGRGDCGANGRIERISPPWTMTSSPGSTERTYSAPTTSSATVSEAKMVASPNLPITSGRMPSGSRQAIIPSGVMQTKA